MCWGEILVEATVSMNIFLTATESIFARTRDKNCMISGRQL